MNWYTILEFARGPLFRAAWLVFVGGMAYRLAKVIFLGWKRDKVPPAGSKLGGVVKSFLKGALVWPFIPWVKRTFSKNMVTYLAGGLFHLGLLVVLIFGTPHMLAWKSLLGFGWPTLPLPITDWLAAVAIVAMVVLLINRLVNPVLKLLTGPAEWLNWTLVFLPMVSGYLMTHHVINPYEKAFALHMLTVDFLLIWIPLSRISHFIFYFFSRTYQGIEFGKRGVNP
jgi:nitrate reductase gamma subunit